MHIADAHCDYLYQRILQRAGAPVVTEKALLAGKVKTQVFAAFANAAKLGTDTAQAYRRQIDAFSALRRRLEAAIPGFRAVLAIEGAEAFGHCPEALAHALRQEARIVTLTWNHENALGFPHTCRGGLKPFGREAVGIIRAHHGAVDVSHLNQDGFWDVCALCDTLMASHSCADALCPHSRNLTDEQARAIIDKKGFIGVNFYPPFLRADGRATVLDAAAHVVHFLSLGGEDAVGFGSDFDGIESTPQGLEGPADFPALLDALRALGVTPRQLEKIAHENLERFLAAL